MFVNYQLNDGPEHETVVFIHMYLGKIPKESRNMLEVVIHVYKPNHDSELRTVRSCLHTTTKPLGIFAFSMSLLVPLTHHASQLCERAAGKRKPSATSRRPYLAVLE